MGARKHQTRMDIGMRGDTDSGKTMYFGYEEEERFISNNNYISTQMIYIHKFGILYLIEKRGKQKLLTYI